MPRPTPQESNFVRQCRELSDQMSDVLYRYPKEVGLCVAVATMAAMMVALKLPREIVTEMLDDAQEQMRNCP